jgi:hypothetical protein
MSGTAHHHHSCDGGDSGGQAHQGVVRSHHLRQVCDVDAAGNLVADEAASAQAADQLQGQDTAQ